jgi:hypothetical protein
MPATDVATTATMESASAMEATAAHRVAVVAATSEAASNRGSSAVGYSVSITIAVTGATIAVTGVSVPVYRPSIVAAAIAVKTAVSVSISAIPGAGTDEHSAHEPRRSIVPVRRAGIRIVAVVAIGAHRSRIAVTVSPIHRGTDPNSNRHLRMRISRSREQQDTEYS